MPHDTKAIINFLTVFIDQIADDQHRKQLEYALARTMAMMQGDKDTLAKLVPPYIPKHVS